MKLVIANWKKHPASEAEAVSLAEAYEKIPIPESMTVVACPPDEFLDKIGGKMVNFALGAQNLLDPAELKELGVEYIILGHSDRRAEGETDEEIRGKVELALQYEFKVILCVGEPLEIRNQGISAAKEFVLNQLANDMPKDEFLAAEDFSVAYEPIWSISTSGSGQIDTPEKAAEMITVIKNKYPATRVLYGGSVNSETAAGFLARPEIEGVLVGQASLNADEFQKIITIAGQ